MSFSPYRATTRTSGPGVASYAELNEKNAAFCGSMPKPSGCAGSMSSLTSDPGQKNCSAGRPAVTFLTRQLEGVDGELRRAVEADERAAGLDEGLQRGDAGLAEPADVLVRAATLSRLPSMSRCDAMPGSTITSNAARRLPARTSASRSVLNGNSYCSNSQRVQPSSMASFQGR